MGNPAWRALWPWHPHPRGKAKARKQARRLRQLLAGERRRNGWPGPLDPDLSQAWAVGHHGGALFALREAAYDRKMLEHPGHESDRAFKAARRKFVAGLWRTA